MYDSGKIIAGLVLFIIAAAFPVWYTHAAGKPGYRPEPVLPEGKTNCVESKEYMLSEHMNLLDEWRDMVVRENKRVYVATDGKEYEMSLTETCLDCHSEKEEFCDRCHDYADEDPYCWDCHVEEYKGAKSIQQTRIGTENSTNSSQDAQPSNSESPAGGDASEMAAQSDSETDTVTE
jgi:hypothetical protein